MEDRLPLATPPVERFLCPGQSRPIERAVHLSRLAAFDPACLACPERHDTAGLTSLTIAARQEVERRAPAGWQWTADAVTTSDRGELDRQLPRQFALAMADMLWASQRRRPTVHVGASGSHHARELMATMCRALELAGCETCEVGTATAPCLAAGIAQAGASGGIWIGNASGREHELALLAVGQRGTPWSLPGSLSELQSRLASSIVRPRRSGGNLQRYDATTCYVAAFRDAFHGLRALEFVLHTVSRSTTEYVQILSRETALRVQRLDASRPRAAPDDLADPLAAEISAVAHEVVLAGAHFGLWIDGAGQRCQLVDECGHHVPHVRLLGLMKRTFEAPTGEPLPLRLAPKVETREQIGERMLAVPDKLAGDGHGCYWFADHTYPDGLALLCALLGLLSRSDRPLSEVLDADATAL